MKLTGFALLASIVLSVAAPLPAIATEGCDSSSSKWKSLPSEREVFGEKDGDKRLKNVICLEGFGAASVPLLVRALKDDNWEIRAIAIRFLEIIGPAAKDSLPSILPLTRDSEVHVRREAISASQLIDPKGDYWEISIPVLKQGYADVDSEVRRLADQALNALTAARPAERRKSEFKSYRIEDTPHIPMPKDPGISDQELEKLGNSADSVMASRFDNPANQTFQLGLLERMLLFGDLEHPSPAINKSVIAFIERSARTCSGEVPVGRVFDIQAAFKVIGARGGSEGLKYLQGWVSDEGTFGRIKCYATNFPTPNIQEHLRRSALRGIGLQGSDEANRYLTALLKDPPDVKPSGTFPKIIQEALATNSKVQTEGQRKYWEWTRNRSLDWSSHQKR